MENCTRLLFGSLFERDLQLLENQDCDQCDAQVRHSLLPWLVGAKFPYSAERVLFIGKPHSGTPGEILPSGIIDPINEVKVSLWAKEWPCWSYTREIAENLYGESASDFIAFSNVIKCTNVEAEDGDSRSTDNTTYQMAHCCIERLGVIWKEVERLEPMTIVFYTFGLFREMLENIPVAVDGTIQEISTLNHSVPCGSKQLGWWERKCATSWTNNLRILVVGHPERMERQEYVALVTGWIRPSNEAVTDAMNDAR